MKGAVLLIDAAGHDAAVDYQQMTRDEAGSVGGEKHGGACQLIELAEALHGRAKQKFPPALCSVEKGGIQVRAQNAWNERVDTNA